MVQRRKWGAQAFEQLERRAGVTGTSGSSGGTLFGNPSAKVGTTPVNGSSSSAMRADAAPEIDQAMAPTWTAEHAFSAGMTISDGIKSDVADGASAVAFDLDDTVSRSQGTALLLRNSADGAEVLQIDFHGGMALGYGSIGPQSDTLLAFQQSNANDPAGFEKTMGILAGIINSDGFAAPRLVGAGNYATHSSNSSALTAAYAAGSISSVGCDDTATGYSSKKLISHLARLHGSGALTSRIVSGSIDSIGGSDHPRGDWGEAVGYYSEYYALSGRTVPTYRPIKAIGSVFNIPGYSADAVDSGEQWGSQIRALTADSPRTPAVGGGLHVECAARGTRRTQIYMVPVAASSGGFSGAVDGDLVWDDGTNNAKGAWQYSGGWEKLLGMVSVDALGGGASATLGTIGGSGPATAAQNTWIQFVGRNGTTYWLPAWT